MGLGKDVTYTQLVKRVAKRTGYPEATIRNILGATREVFREAILRREVIQLRGLFNITPLDRLQTVRSRKDGSTTTVGRLMLSIRPVRAFRNELNRWSTEEKPIWKSSES